MQKSKTKDQKLVQNSKPKMEVRYRAFYLSIDVIKFLETLQRKPSLRIIINQLIRSITSVGANIVEAKAASSKREFVNYFQIALKSANETKYWLAMLKELLPEKREEVDVFIREIDEISKIIGSSVLTMKGKKKL